MRTIMVAALAAAFVGGCKKKDNKPATTGSGAVTPGSGSAMATGSGSDVATGSGSAVVEPALPPGAARVKGDFQVPESVLYDKANDVYLVSNINGKPTDKDDNGFISKVSPDGAVTALKWIDGAAEDVKLDAPKGMAIANGVLYVADITVVRKFDLKTGKAQGEIALDGATFVNDVVAAPDGKTIYATDSGLAPDFSPSGSDAVWKIVGDKPVALAKDKTMGNPNGIVTSADGKSVWVATFGTGELREITGKGEVKPGTKLPKGQLDGIVWVGDELIVSSWEGKAVYRGKPGGEWKEIASNLEAPADIGYDDKRKQLLVPRFNGNDVVIVPVP